MNDTALDVIVVGAGTAGATAAWHLARGGARVALIDHRRPDAAGARWINGVPPWMFDEAQVPAPQAPELRPTGGAFSICGLAGIERVRLSPNPVWAVDMRLLVRRLQGLAVGAGARLIAPARVVDVPLDPAGRPTGVTLHLDGEPLPLRARLIVDATGLAGAVRSRVPALLADCPPTPPEHVCSAAQAVHAVDDPDAARAAFAAWGLRPGDLRSTVGLDGGYSTANLGLSPDGDEVELLAGAIALPAHRSGPAILRDLAQAHPWIGERRFGGAGAIPLRRPYDRLGAPGVALLGNAACQVFSAHGSGIGIGMMAARLLAEAALAAADPGSEAAVWAYQASFQRRWGGLLASYDLFRRATQGLTGEETDQLMANGLMGPSSSRAALEQRLIAPHPGEVLRVLGGALRAPRLTGHVAAALARMPRALALYRRAPRRPDRAALVRWSGRVGALFDERPDLH